METPTQTPNGAAPTEPTPNGAGGETPPIETPPAGPEPTPKEPVDYEKKFGESTTENQRIMEKNSKLEEDKAALEAKLAVKTASETLSDEELAKKNPDWDVLSDSEKTSIRNSEEIRLMKEKQAWTTDLATVQQWATAGGYKVDPEAFKAFCYLPENRGSKNVLNLAKAFVHDQKQPAEVPPSPNPGMEPPTGGAAPVDDGVMTKEKAEQIRMSDPKAYKKLVLSGKLDNIK